MPLLPTFATVNCRALPSLPPAPLSGAVSFFEPCCCDRSRSMSVLFLTLRSEFCRGRPPRFSGDVGSALTPLFVVFWDLDAASRGVTDARALASVLMFVFRAAGPVC